MVPKQVIEALLFAAQKPLPVKEILAALRSAAENASDEWTRLFAIMKEPAVLAALRELQADYEESGRAFVLTETVSGWALATQGAYSPWVRQLYPESKPARLSGPALETLAIIAYRQPITKADIEAVRGVAVEGVLQSILDRGLVKIAGRSDLPGRPLLYETTRIFMEHFGLRSLAELPNADELRRVALPKATGQEGQPGQAASPAKGTKSGTSKANSKPDEVPSLPAETGDGSLATDSSA